MNPQDLQVQVVVGLTLAGALVLGGMAIYRYWRQRSARQKTLRAVEAVAAASLRDIVVPDGSGGHLHLDFLLLTTRGLLVVDLRDVTGVVFGGEHMREWTVMNGIDRSTFFNPLESLYDRVAAVKLLAGEVPVEGRIVFTDRATFPKGRPPQVLRLGSLEAEFPYDRRSGTTAAIERYRPVWDAIAGVAEPSPLARR